MLIRKRNYKYGLIICSLCLMSIALTSIQGRNGSINTEPVWERVYETPNDERPTQFLRAEDGGYIITGSYLVGSASQTPWLMKVDSNGNEEWNKSYHLSTGSQGHLRSIVTTSDGGYAVAGFLFSTSSDRATWDLWVLKLDNNGNEEWNRTFNGPEDGPDYAAQIALASDGGFLISGATQSKFALPTETWNTDYWLIKTDVNGNEEWNKTYHRVGSDQGTGLVPLTDGNYLLYGLSKQTSDLNSAFSVWVVKVDENGTIIWEHAYDKGTDWYGAWERNLIETSDGGFLLSCYSFGNIYSMGNDYWIIKCDSEGDIEWNTTFGGNYYDTPCVCLQSSTGEYYIGGAYNSASGSEETGDMCIVRIDSSGAIRGYITYGKVTKGERIVDMILTDSGTAIVALAFVDPGGSGLDYWDCWLGKFDNVNEITMSTTTISSTTSSTTGSISPTSSTPTATVPVSFLGAYFPLFILGVLLAYRRKRK
ncbi:MAG: hypothetical protein ACFFAU_12365 [Candidatus Hodarchaeota archaeon]